MEQPVASLSSRDLDCTLHPFTDLDRLKRTGPLVITRGTGIHVFDDQGRDYVDGLAGLWCASLGFANDRLADVAAAQMRTLAFYHTFGGKCHAPGILLAERLLELMPVPMAKVFLASSGSEANDVAVKLIGYYNNALGRPRKKKIIARQRGYHGMTMMAASLTGLPNAHRGFDVPLPGILHAGCPHHWRFGRPGETGEEFSVRLAEELEDMILTEGPDTVAAFFAEPVMGAGGVIVPPAGYFTHIQAVLRKYDVLLVADEVITGFGRTGNMFGCQTFNIRPDMVVLAKALSAGTVPISALVVSKPIADALQTQAEAIGMFHHGLTYGGHPVAAAVALETLKIYEEMDLIGRVRRLAGRFQAGLRRLAPHPLVGEVRGVGLIGAVELVQDKASREPFPPTLGVGQAVMAHAQAHGLLIRAMGDAIAFAPPLIIDEAEIDDMLERFRRALDDAQTAGIRARAHGR